MDLEDARVTIVGLGLMGGSMALGLQSRCQELVGVDTDPETVELARRAGIRRRVHLHGFRHTHAVELVREGAPLPEVQAQLGHSSLAVTSRYLAHVTPEDLAARARGRPRWTG